MTSPFTDYSGSEVTASLDINVSDDSIRNLADVQAIVAEIRADMEAAARATQDLATYTLSLRDIAKTVTLPGMAVAGGGEGNMSYSGGRVDNTMVPIAAMGAGAAAERIMQMEENSGGISRGAAVSPQEAGGVQVGGGAPIGVGAGRGGGTNWLYDMMNFTYLASMLGQLNQGGGQTTNTGNSGLLSQLLGPLGKHKGALSIGGGVLAAYGAMRTYGGMRRLGREFGSDAGGGLGMSLQAHTMGLSPFISSGEANDIVNTAIAEGYGGEGNDQFNRATEFAYVNARNLNMSVSDSFSLLESNVRKAGQSLNGLTTQIGHLGDMAKGSNTSLADITSQVLQVNGLMTSAGNSGYQSVSGGMLAASLFQNNDKLRGQGGNIISTLGQNPTALSWLANLYNLQNPYAAPGVLSANQMTSGLMDFLKTRADYYMNIQKNNPQYGAYLFSQELQAYGLNYSPEDAYNLMTELHSGKTLSNAQDYLNKTGAGNMHPLGVGETFTRAGKSGWELTESSSGWLVGGAARGIGAFLHIGSLNEWGRNVQHQEGSDLSYYGSYFSATGTGHTGDWVNPTIDSLVKQYGAHNVVYVDKSGKVLGTAESGFLNNDKNRAGLQSGEIQISINGQAATLQQLSMGGTSAISGDNNGGIYGNMTIDLTPRAQQLVQILGGNSVPLSQHQTQAGMGYGGATPNNAPPGG